MDQFLEVLKSSNFDSRIYLRHLWGYISKKIFGSPGAPVTEIPTSKILQPPKNAHVRAKKNQCSRINFIKICDAWYLKMTPILHFSNNILVHFINKVSRLRLCRFKICGWPRNVLLLENLQFLSNVFENLSKWPTHVSDILAKFQ